MANRTFRTPDFGITVGTMCFLINRNDTQVYSTAGVWNNEYPLNFSLPTLMLQIIVIYTLSRCLYFLLRPVRQPRVVCDFLAGVLLGPSIPLLWKPGGFWSDGYLGRKLFPQTQKRNVRTLAVYGLMYYIFLIAVKMDLRLVTRPRRQVLIMTAGRMVVPLLLTTIASRSVHRMYKGLLGGEYLLILPASQSTTALPVLADILSEIHLLNSELGRLSMSSTLFNNLVGWFFMAFSATAIRDGSDSGSNNKVNLLMTILAFVGMLVFVVFVFRPWVVRLARRTPKGALVREGEVFVIMFTVLFMGMVGDLTGSSFLIGPLLLGLAVPDGPPLGATLVQRTEAVVTELLLPLTFAMAGQNFNLRAALLILTKEDWAKWIGVMVVIFLAYIGTLVGTMASALYCKMSMAEAFVLGLMMNFKGVIEIISYLQLKMLQTMDVTGFTLLLLSNALVTGICVPLVEILYKPLSSSQNSGWRTVQRLKPHEELRLLACVHNEDPSPVITNIIEASSGEGRSVCAYVLHLVELVGAVNSSLIAHKDKKGFINPTRMDPLLNAFIAYEQQKKGEVAVLPFTTVTPYKTMHQDVCALATEKDAAMIVLPFPRRDAHGGGMGEADQAMRGIVSEVLSNAPCSVGMLVYHAVAYRVMPSPAQFRHRVGALFWGGPDDREALACASRMARHAGVSLTVTRFVPKVDPRVEEDRQLDDGTMEEFMLETSGNERVVVEEVVVKNIEETFAAIRSMDRGYDLLLLGRRHGSSSILEEGLAAWSEWKELGVLGDALASPDFDCTFSMLVVQQHH